MDAEQSVPKRSTPETGDARSKSPQAVILAVDDEPVARRVVSRALGDHFEVISASSAQEALGYLRCCRFDLVLTDIMMPDMDGLSLADQVLQAFPTMPIAFLSAYLGEEMRIQATRRTPHLIPKPVEVNELVTAVQNILRRASLLRPEQVVPEEKPRYQGPTGARRAEMERNLSAAAIVCQLKKTVAAGKTFRTRMTDERMAPALRVGDVLEVAEAGDLEWMRKGALVFIHQGDALHASRFVERVRVRGSLHFVVRGDANRDPEPPLPASHLIGRVVRVEREGKTIRVAGTGGQGAGGVIGQISGWLQDLRTRSALHGGDQ